MNIVYTDIAKAYATLNLFLFFRPLVFQAKCLSCKWINSFLHGRVQCVCVLIHFSNYGIVPVWHSME